MTRSIVTGLLGLLSVVAVGILPAACQSGGVGDPCTPEDEYNPQFAGFKVTEENIESRSFQCQTRICLVNHFQGRVSCPLGQPPPKSCSGTSDTACGKDADGANIPCVETATLAPDCIPKQKCEGGPPDCPEGCEEADGECIKIGTGNAACAGFGGTCVQVGEDPNSGSCRCKDTNGCQNSYCADFNSATGYGQCKSYVCHKGDCQIPTAAFKNTEEANKANEGKACCIPGTNTPVAAPVCGQCDEDTNRNADGAVYCSCRCGVAEGEPEDPNFNFCECPSGFECSEIRKNVGLGDEQITGKYCIKQNSAFKSEQSCGPVRGYFNSQQCKGPAASGGT